VLRSKRARGLRAMAEITGADGAVIDQLRDMAPILQVGSPIFPTAM
jgi:hypothetical protein